MSFGGLGVYSVEFQNVAKCNISWGYRNLLVFNQVWIPVILIFLRFQFSFHIHRLSGV